MVAIRLEESGPHPYLFLLTILPYITLLRVHTAPVLKRWLVCRKPFVVVVVLVLVRVYHGRAKRLVLGFWLAALRVGHCRIQADHTTFFVVDCTDLRHPNNVLSKSGVCSLSHISSLPKYGIR